MIQGTLKVQLPAIAVLSVAKHMITTMSMEDVTTDGLADDISFQMTMFVAFHHLSPILILTNND